MAWCYQSVKNLCMLNMAEKTRVEWEKYACSIPTPLDIQYDPTLCHSQAINVNSGLINDIKVR